MEPPVLRDGVFLRFWGGSSISTLGNQVTVIALPWLVLQLTNSPFQLGIVGALEFLPFLLFGLVVGVYADRWDRRTILLFADLVRFGLLPAGRNCLVEPRPSTTRSPGRSRLACPAHRRPALGGSSAGNPREHPVGGGPQHRLHGNHDRFRLLRPARAALRRSTDRAGARACGDGPDWLRRPGARSPAPLQD